MQDKALVALAHALMSLAQGSALSIGGSF